MLVLLGIFDIIAGFSILLKISLNLTSRIILTIGVIMLFKSIVSIISSFKIGYYLDWQGFIDFLSGLILIGISLGYPFSLLIGLLLIGKGAYSVVS